MEEKITLSDTRTYLAESVIQANDGSWIDGMAAGEFITMLGRKIEVEQADLKQYVINTNANLTETQDKDGNLVGLPIDQMDHAGMAAGWITDVRLAQDGRPVIEFKVRWNDLGKELIESDQLRYFSPTFNMSEKVIVGGSLTNWPATRDEKEKMLLKPVALSLSMFQMDERQGLFSLIERKFEDLKTALGFNQREDDGKPKIERKPMDELLENPEVKAEINRLSEARAEELAVEKAEELAEQRVAEALALEKRQAHVAEYTARVVGAKNENKVGLAIDQDSLSKFMLSIEPEQQEQFEEILDQVLEQKLIDFTEQGHGKQLAGKQPLPENMQAQLASWLATQAGTIGEWFGVNADMLGDMEDYDLTKFKED